MYVCIYIYIYIIYNIYIYIFVYIYLCIYIYIYIHTCIAQHPAFGSPGAGASRHVGGGGPGDALALYFQLFMFNI